MGLQDSGPDRVVTRGGDHRPNDGELMGTKDALSAEPLQSDAYSHLSVDVKPDEVELVSSGETRNRPNSQDVDQCREQRGNAVPVSRNIALVVGALWFVKTVIERF